MLALIISGTKEAGTTSVECRVNDFGVTDRKIEKGAFIFKHGSRTFAFYESDEIKRKTQLHFQNTRQAEVRGFPTLVINTGSDFKKISAGYSSFDVLKVEIDNWLQEHQSI